MNTVLHNKLIIVTGNKDQHLWDSEPQQHFLPHTNRMSHTHWSNWHWLRSYK